MTIKVSDLAKELEVSVDEILDQMRRLFVDAEDESSKVDEKIAALIRHKFGGAKPKKPRKNRPLPRQPRNLKKHPKKKRSRAGKVRKLTFPPKRSLPSMKPRKKIWKR
jgi:hypothetical protein